MLAYPDFKQKTMFDSQWLVCFKVDQYVGPLLLLLQCCMNSSKSRKTFLALLPLFVSQANCKLTEYLERAALHENTVLVLIRIRFNIFVINLVVISYQASVQLSQVYVLSNLPILLLPLLILFFVGGIV